MVAAGGLLGRWTGFRRTWRVCGRTPGLTLPVRQHAPRVDGVGMIGTHARRERGDPAGPAVTVVGRTDVVAGIQEFGCRAGVSELQVMMWRRDCPVVPDEGVLCNPGFCCVDTVLGCHERLVGPRRR